MVQNTSKAAEKTTTPQATWPDFFASLFDKLVGGSTGTTYEFNDFELYIPSKLGDGTDHFHWKMNGSLRIHSEGTGNQNANE